MTMNISDLQDLKNITPEIIKLKFSEFFKGSLNGGQLIPPWIKSIIFEHECEINESFDFLPERLEILIFGYYKNHTLEEINNYPKNLKILELASQFIQELKPDILPPNLEELFFWRVV